MTPDRAHVRRWYAASVTISLPWWLALGAPLRLLAAGYAIAWAIAWVATPRVDGRRRTKGLLLGIGLTFAGWLAGLAVLGRLYGDG